MSSNNTSNPVNNSLTQSSIKSVSWLSFGTGFNMIFQLIVFMILARLITPEEFGLMSAAMVIIGFAGLFSELGIGQSLIQRSNLNQTHISSGFLFTIFFGTVLTILIYLLASFISIIFKMEDLENIIKILSILFFIKSLGVVSESLIQRNMKFKYLTLINNTSYIFGYGFTGIFLAYYGMGVWSLVYATLTQAILSVTILLILQKHSKRINPDIKSLKELLYFGGGFSIAKTMNYIALKGDKFVTGRWLGAESLGYYSRAFSLINIPVELFANVLDKVLFPAMSKIQNQKDKLKTAYIKGLTSMTVLSLPIAIIMFMMAEEIIFVVLGNQWVDAIIPFKILSIGLFFRMCYKVSDAISRALGAVYKRARRQFVFALLIISGSYLGQYWGINGVAIAVVIALFFNFIFMTILSMKLIQLNFNDVFDTIMTAIPISVSTFILFFLFIYLSGIFGFSAFNTLLFSIILYVFYLFLALRYFPFFLFGKNAMWLKEIIVNILNVKFLK